jgi:hypothetical protein
MEDAAVVTILFQRSPTLISSRVRGFCGFPVQTGDPTTMWLLTA